MQNSILIYGEFSGYGKSLSKGFNELGFHSKVLNFNGDGFKKIKGDINISGKSRLSIMCTILKLLSHILSFKNILIVNPGFMDFTYLGPLILILAKIKKRKIILLACGDDVELIKAGESGNLGCWNYIDTPYPRRNYLKSFRERVIHYLTAKLSDNIVPVMYDYQKSWALSKYRYKVTNTIPLACDGATIEFKKTNDIIKIMHGINREGFKGTHKIKLALAKLKQEFNTEVEIVYPKQLPLSEYVELLENVDISIDQTKGNSYGMNAIYSLFAGHIVLAPANNNFKADLGISDCPIIPITNDTDSIYQSLKELVLNKHELNVIKKNSQDYAKNIHSPKVVAAKFIKYLNLEATT